MSPPLSQPRRTTAALCTKRSERSRHHSCLLSLVRTTSGCPSRFLHRRAAPVLRLWLREPVRSSGSPAGRRAAHASCAGWRWSSCPPRAHVPFLLSSDRWGRVSRTLVPERPARRGNRERAAVRWARRTKTVSMRDDCDSHWHAAPTWGSAAPPRGKLPEGVLLALTEPPPSRPPARTGGTTNLAAVSGEVNPLRPWALNLARRCAMQLPSP